MGFMPRVTYHAIIRYVERVKGVKTLRIRKRLRRIVKWIDQCVNRAESATEINYAEVDYYLAIKRRRIDHELLSWLRSEVGVEIGAVRDEIRQLIRQVSEQQLHRIARCKPVEIPMGINGLVVIFVFEDRRLVTVKNGHRQEEQKSQRRAAFKALVRQARIDELEDALAM